MKYLNYRKVWVLALVVVFMSCSLNDELDEINQNPNAPALVPSEFIMPAIFVEAATTISTSVNATVMNLWVQHWGSPIYADEDQYDLRDETINIVWDRLYARVSQDAFTVMKIGTENADVNHVAIGQIMRTYALLVMTNIWGDIPYSEANRGAAEDGGILTPVYDLQSSIYPALITDLNNAISMMNFSQSNVELATFDLMYGGDMTMWRKFAKSLQMRIYMNLSEVDPTTAASGLNTLITAGDFIGPGEDAQIGFGTATTSGNPVSEWLNNRQDDFRVSETSINFGIKAADGGTDIAPADPRLTLYASLSNNSIYEGEQNGLTGNFDVSKVGEYYGGPGSSRRNSMPYQFMSAAEVMFIRAEAAQRGWTAESDAAMYDAAITESFTFNGLSAAQAATYLALPSVAYDGTLQRLSEQKWYAMYMQGNEAFSNWRRTGFPVLQVSFAHRNTINEIPRRWDYPTDEFSSNQSNAEAAVARGLVDQNSKVYIDP